MNDSHSRLTRPAAALAARPLGWGFLLGNLVTTVAADSIAGAAGIAAMAIATAAADADTHLQIDLRSDRCELRLHTRGGGVGRRDLELAAAITAAVSAAGHVTVADGGVRAVQMLEICVDAMDIPVVLPFWRAVFGYHDTSPPDDGAVADPLGTGPTVWFQQMDEPRTQRNRIHFDITVTEDEAEPRIAATLAAGGRLVSADEAKAFWILADPEGNEVCVCTWQDRD